MSWSAWGLDGLDDEASDRFVIEGGGRLLALGLLEHRPVEVERLSERWSVSVGTVRAGAPWPAVGDVVIWGAMDRSHPPAGYAWGSPTRVLGVQEDEPGVIAMSLLEDARASERGRAIRTDWLEDVLAEHRAVPVGEQWRILESWGLQPLCPRCGATSRSIIYGMPSPDLFESDDVVLGGCVVVDDEPADYQCSGCGHEF